MSEQKEYWKTSLLDESDFDLTFQLPDIHKLKQDRKERNANLLRQIDAKTRKVVNSEKDCAALKIQRMFRGYIGRKEYINRLYNDVLIGEEKLYKQQERQVQEGEILIETYKIERDLEENDQITKNKSRLLNTNAMLIQRAWREHSKFVQKDHICCSCNDYYPDLFDYYNSTKTICFCCETHRLNPEEDQLLDNINTSTNLLPYPTSDWLNIDIAHSNNEELQQRRFESKLTFVESYESDVDKPQVEIYNPSSASDDMFIDINIEKVTDSAKCRSPDALEPFIESTRVLKSLEIHEEYDKRKRKESAQHDYFNIKKLLKKSILELTDIIDKLNDEISCKNVELVEELMIRDELHSNHESLLIDAGDLAKMR